MTTTIQQRSGASSWQSFCEWVTSTNNRQKKVGSVC